ncbi:MAG: hypothetical protein HJJLKODD_01920 [Phycisphaerae bacterium]|nr:hypothetical protein [Phycisphaerae bacterium]
MSVSTPKQQTSVRTPISKFQRCYAAAAVDRLIEMVRPQWGEAFKVADVEAGSGRLATMLSQRGANCHAVESDPQQRRTGHQATLEWPVNWLAGTATQLPLESSSVDLVTYGANFERLNRPRALQEAVRVLRPCGYIAILNNDRDLLLDPIQSQSEKMIRYYLPEYQQPKRCSDPRPLLEACGLFHEVVNFEIDHFIELEADVYLQSLYDQIMPTWAKDDRSTEPPEVLPLMSALAWQFASLRHLRLRFITRVWVARRN